jgi:hypothetical protein
MDLLTKKERKKLSASFHWYFPRKNIIYNSVGDYLKIF